MYHIKIFFMKTLSIKQMESINCGSDCAQNVLFAAIGVVGMIGAIATLGPGAALFWSTVGFIGSEWSTLASIEGMIKTC